MRASAAKTSTLLVEGQGFRRRTLELSPTLRVDYLEVADVDAALEEAIGRDGPAPYGVVAWGSSVAVARALFEARALGAEVYVADPGRVFRARFLAALSAAGTVASFRTVAVHVPGEERSSEVGLLVLGGEG